MSLFHATKAHRRRRGVDQLTMALDGGEWLTPRPGRLYPWGKIADTQ